MNTIAKHRLQRYIRELEILVAGSERELHDLGFDARKAKLVKKKLLSKLKEARSLLR